MSRDAFVLALIDIKDRTVNFEIDAPEARQEVGHAMRLYLVGLGCTPSMLDWAADQVHDRYNDELITVQSGFRVADELERLVRS